MPAPEQGSVRRGQRSVLTDVGGSSIAVSRRNSVAGASDSPCPCRDLCPSPSQPPTPFLPFAKPVAALMQGQLTEAIAQRLFLQLLTALEFRRTMGASQDFLVDDVLLATSPPTKADGDGVPTIKT